MPHLTIESITLSPPLITMDGRHLDELLERWLTHKSRTVAPSTLQNYKEKLEYFRQWWRKIGPEQDYLLTQEDIEDFEIYLAALPSQISGEALSYHTRNDALRRLRQALGWAFATNKTVRNYSEWIPTTSGAAPSRHAIHLDALRQLLDATGWQPDPMRAKAIIALLAGAGLRRSECTNLHTRNITLYADNSGHALTIGKRTRANPTGERAFAFRPSVGRYLRSHLDQLDPPSGFVFRNLRTGQPLTPTGLYRIVRTCIQDAELEEVITGCHDLRRLFATICAHHRPGEGHADALRRQLGHTSYRQTAAYVLTEAEDLIDLIISPFDFLSG